MNRHIILGLCGVLAGVFASLALATLVLYERGFWATSGARLRWLSCALLTGCVGQLLSLCAFSAYIALAIVFKQSTSAPAPASS